MKLLLFFALLSGSLALPRTDMRAIDDPPPEPVDCPLCGGDPALHARRMFAITRLSSDVVSYSLDSLRW